MKRTLAILLLVCMLVSLFAGCGGNPDSSTTASNPTSTPVNTPAEEESISDKSGDLEAEASDTYLREKVVVAISGDGQTFDPFSMANWGSVVFPLFQTLAYTDSEGNIRYCILKNFEMVDELTYEAEIWPFIYDSEGNNITASDVKWSIDYYVAAGHSGGVNCLDSIEVTGDYTIIWHCKQAFGLGEMSKNLGNCKIVSQKAYEARGEDGMASDPAGTGAYVLESYVPGSSVTFVANEDFWMKNITDEAWLAEHDYVINFQNVKSIEYQIIVDAGSRAIALEMGTVDAADSLNAADVDYFVQNPDLGVSPVEVPQSPPVAFYYNCNELSPCSDVNLRKAICYALDNVAIAAGISFPGQAAYGMHPRMYDAPESWTTGEGRDYYNYNIEKAKECLAASSYKGETLVAMYMQNGAIPDVVIMMQAALKEIGITLELLPADMSVLNEYKLDYTKWDMMFDILGGGNYLSATLKRFWTEDSAKSCNGMQVTGIVDTKLDELFVAMKADTNDETIEAWDNYFTYEMCYGYAVCLYSNQTAARSDVNCVLTGAQHNVTPQAFTFID